MRASNDISDDFDYFGVQAGYHYQFGTAIAPRFGQTIYQPLRINNLQRFQGEGRADTISQQRLLR